MARPNLNQIKMARASSILLASGLGFFLLLHSGCTQKDRTADDLRTRASKGDAEAQWRLGVQLSSSGKDDNTQQEAFLWLSKSAGQGSLKGEFNLGKMYWNGRGTEANRAQALQLIRKAAENGLPEAEQWMGEACLKGAVIEKDYQQAQAWFLKAAEQNFPPGEYALGQLYTHKHPKLPWDFSKAQSWITKAAEQGHRPAQKWLASYLAHPRLGKPDPVEAYKWALASDDSEAAQSISTHLTPAQIATAQQRADEFTPLRGSLIQRRWNWLMAGTHLYWFFGVVIVSECAAIWFWPRKKSA